MKRQRPTIDGFVPRRSTSQLGEFHNPSQPPQDTTQLSGHLHRYDGTEEAPVLIKENIGLSRSDIDDSLRDIDNEQVPESRRARRRRLKKAAPKSKLRRIIKWVVIVILVGLLAAGVYTGYKILSASGSVFKGNFFDLIQAQPLKQDASGRTNILIVGTSEDDPG